MIMHTEKKDNRQEIASPPLPPVAVFDEQHMAEAQPVQPLRHPQSRKPAAAFPQIFGRRFTIIATMIAGMIISVGVGAASVDWGHGPLSSKETPQVASEPLAPSTALLTENAPAPKRQDQKRRSLPNPQARGTPPPFESDEGGDNRKPRARLVSVVH